MSDAMLTIAAGRAVYESCRKMVLGERLDFQDATFGAVVAAGVFTAGHAPAHVFSNWLEFVARHGFVVLGLRADGETGEVYRAACAAQEGMLWRLVAESAAFQAFPLSPAEAHVLNIVRVYQVLRHFGISAARVGPRRLSARTGGYPVRSSTARRAAAG